MARATRTSQDKPKAPPPEPEVARGNGIADEEESLDDYIVAAPDARPEQDDFDNLERFALPQDFNPDVEEEDPPVPCCNPPKADFFCVNPAPEMTAIVGIVELRDERDEPYLVTPNMFAVFGSMVSRRQLVICRTMQGKIFLWALKLPHSDRRSSGRWTETRLKAAVEAKTRWTRIDSDMDLKCYRIFHPRDKFPLPDWSKTPPLLDLMRRAFGDGYLIKDGNHPLVRRVRGVAK